RRLVLHRIVRIQGEHFVLKGDANTWLDSDKPTQAEIVGRTWIHLPVGGGILAWLRTPINAAIVAGIFGLLAFGGAANRRSRRNRLRRGRKDAPPRRAPIPEPQAGYGRLAPLGGAAGGAIGAIVILVFALSRPASVERTEEIAYTHTGDFTYSAEASPSQAYEADVKTGDPVFVRLAPVVDVGFEYRLDSQIPAALSGTIGLSAELQDGAGWRRRIPVTAPVPFRGMSTTAEGTIDLRRVNELLRDVERDTGIGRPSVILRLFADVHLRGKVGGAPIDERFVPNLPFELEPLMLRLYDPVGDAPPTEALRPTKQGTATVVRDEPNRIPLPGLRFDVAGARAASAVAVPLFLLALALTSRSALRLRPRSESERIRQRHARRIVPLYRTDHLSAQATVDVTSMEALVRLAETYERMVMQIDREDVDEYLVEGDVVVYRYRVAKPLDEDAAVGEAG
ncbi:MAG TPA: DUF5305 family protein, partial [Actinomycetota bacterium]|nr:DUF5305 family protein [Actinomycetota bacterium]